MRRVASAGAGLFNTAEDIPVALTGLAGTLIDADGSETLSYAISGVPAGASFDRGTDLGGGNWRFTAADLAAGPVFTPPLDFAGAITLTFTVTSTEADGGASASTSRPLVVSVGDTADMPTVGNTTSVVAEDGAGAFGASVTYALTDTDGSEVIDSVAISGVPAGAVLTWSALPSVTAVTTPGGVIFTGPQADIRAAVDSLALTPLPTPMRTSPSALP